MDRRLGIEVVERDDLVILVDDGRGISWLAILQKMQSHMVGSFLTDQGNYIWSGWLERKVVVGVMASPSASTSLPSTSLRSTETFCSASDKRVRRLLRSSTPRV